jgi:hypothetical protein
MFNVPAWRALLALGAVKLLVQVIARLQEAQQYGTS